MITTERQGDVLVVTSDNPPVNALGHAVRQGLVDAIRAAEGDAGVKAVVIRGAGKTFFAGADITEFGKPMQGPMLPEVVEIIEASSKPVVSAIHGTALGGGLEVALASHYRVAAPSAKFGLPEVKLGILPGAGGTQRLPRVIGVEAALPMVVEGNPINAKKALETGLIDRIVGEDSLVADAVAFANEIKDTADLPRSGRNDAKVHGVPAGAFDAYRQANARKLKGKDAPQACVEAVEAATTMPLEQGLEKERELFFKLVMGTQSKALRHIFFAERAANKIDDLPADTQLIPIRKVGILGAGTMGGGIAMNFLSAGIPVTLLEREQGPLDKGVAIIRKNYERTAQRGRLKPEQVEQAMGLLTPTLSYDDLADCDLVIEAVFELMAIKREVFGKLDQVVKPGAILASNTSYLNVDEIAASTKRPEAVLGLHFFSPANVMRLLEIVRGAKTAPAVLATAMALSKKIGKVAVVSGVCHGFIGNRMLGPRQDQADRLSQEGAKPADVDQVLLDFGWPMGPFQMNDLAGLDIGWDPDKTSSSTVREVLCEQGYRGQKNGKGFYSYDAERNRTPDPEVERIIRDFADKHGVAQRDHSKEEILERLLYPMVNEGALILEEGMAQRASDIDTVWINGYGWPPETGGPMFWADTIGLKTVVAGLEKHRDALGPDFRPSKLLWDKAAKGETFN